MAGKPPIGKRFQKGEVRNPRGAGAHNPVLKAVRRLTNDEVAEIGTLILDGNLEALKQVAKSPESSTLRVWMAMVAIKAVEKGDAQALNVVLDRIAGRTKDTSEVKQEITISVLDYTSKKAEEK